MKDAMATSPAYAPYRFTVAEYHRMGEAGIFPPDARVELIAGEIFEMAPIGSDHAGIVSRLVRLFNRACGDLIVWPQNPVELSEIDEPQPDLALLEARADTYRRAHPRPSDTLLVIEVSDSTLAKDRRLKLPRYALSGIPEVWIVDVKGDRILVFRSPRERRYRVERRVVRGATVSPLALPGLAIGPQDLD